MKVPSPFGRENKSPLPLGEKKSPLSPWERVRVRAEKV
jgi:hypothetical protein